MLASVDNFGATSQDEVAVWEVGMNHPGEVAGIGEVGRTGRRHHYKHWCRDIELHGIISRRLQRRKAHLWKQSGLRDRSF